MDALNYAGFALTVIGGLVAILPDQLSNRQIEEEVDQMWKVTDDFGQSALRRKRAYSRWGFAVAGLGALLQLAGGLLG